MARFTFRLPDIGEGIAEAEIVAWHVKVGDRIEEDQQVADMMTDKATVEMESPVSGVVVELAGEVGDQVAIGASLMVVETEDAVAEDAPAAEEAPADAAPIAEEVEEQIEAETPGVDEVTAELPAAAAPPEPAPVPTPAPAPAPVAEARPVLASPAVRARAKDLGVDLAEVKHDGQHIRHADLDAFLRSGSAQGYHAPHASRAREDASRSACAAASPRTWPRRSARSRTSPRSTRSTSPRWRRCAPT